MFHRLLLLCRTCDKFADESTSKRKEAEKFESELWPLSVEIQLVKHGGIGPFWVRVRQTPNGV